MSLLNNFKSNGFSKISGIFSQDEMNKLRHECFEILDCPKNVCYPELPEPSIPNSFVELYQNDISRINFINQKFRNCIGVSKDIDDLLVKFFHNSEVNEILSHFFIRPKLQFCTIRYADAQSNWLGIHSDSSSTISMSILLNDTYDTDTTTVFIRGSHLYNKPVKNRIERLNPRFFSNIVEYSTGTAGDVNIFFNRTAHGVVKQKRNNKNQFNAVILLCFHCDQNLTHRTLKLPTHTLYGKDINLLDGETLKFFETNNYEREDRNRNIKKESTIDENFKIYRKLTLKEFLTYFYLKLPEYFIKTVRVFMKFTKN